MANIKSAKKRIKTNERNRIRNLSFKSRLKTYLKKAQAAIDTNADDKEAIVRETCKIIDKTISKGIIQKRTGARQKSRLMRLLNASGTAPATTTKAKPKKATKAKTAKPKTETKKAAPKKTKAAKTEAAAEATEEKAETPAKDEAPKEEVAKEEAAESPESAETPEAAETTEEEKATA